MSSTKDLREKRKKLAEDANAILAVAVKESRAASPEEIEKVDKIHADVDALKATIDRIEKSEDEARSFVPDSQRGGDDDKKTSEKPIEQRVAEAAFHKWAVRGASSLTTEEVRALGPQPSGNGSEITLKFPTAGEHRAWKANEQRAQTVTTTGGGYGIAQSFSNRLEKALKWYGTMINEAEVIDTETGAPMPWPQYNDTGNVGAILGINTGVSTQDIAFTSTTLNAFKYSSKQVLIPVELMQDFAFDIDALVADVLGERLGRILNTHFTTGDNSSKPNGVATAATTGVTAATGGSTSVTFANLVDLVYSLDKAYRPMGKFMMNDSTVKAIRKLNDSTGRPIWNVGNPTAGEPDTLYGYPLVVNNDVVVMAANAISILFGNFTKYKVRRVREISLLRLNERYADAHQTGFLAFARFDGQLIDAGTHPVVSFVNSAT